MDNLAWLEVMAYKTHFDVDVHNMLKRQTLEIQIAYQSNDQTLLKKLFGGKEKKTACKTSIFQL